MEKLPSGIPTFAVEITNTCTNGCAISNLHLKCGQFTSATLINPLVFKRIAYDDCLVNNGNPLVAGKTLMFRYATTRQNPLSSFLHLSVTINTVKFCVSNAKLFSYK
ncbi:hypothetical protein HS088_TW09G01439 [Tripterygium wilfordii]|uniref:Protein TAPETUM DETERMINANT 1-like n=1 Tax=Tripterygium wilfordii TaxID=458696 RepID=A0A7J7DAP6_TRIWF|nr:hypothetical protein HS088_TW09G01439 [Tripterygium wilfordii]